ncbi:MAG: signal peptidase II [Aristaeellaceae bacterium]
MLRRYGWIALLVLAVDQAVKMLAGRWRATFSLLPGLLAFTYAENTGMAFSLLSGQSWLLGLFSAGVIVAGLLVLHRYRLGPLPSVAAMLLLGGAAGNMLDRLLRGYVVDMFEVLAFRFAIFNVADAAITVGGILMTFSLLFHPKDWSDAHHADP